MECFINGKWTNTPRDTPVRNYSKDGTKDWYHSRNYEVFSCLAVVRSRGRDQYIAQPRDFPDDVDPVTIAPYNDGCRPQEDESEDDYEARLDVWQKSNPWANDNKADGDHSNSWLLLSEILDWPVWKKPVDDIERIITALSAHAEYSPTIHENCEDFLEVMYELEAWALKKHGLQPHEVRLVFNFDS